MQFSFNVTSQMFMCNIFGHGCASNSFGRYCDSNSFGNHCQYNSFGNNCCYNSFGSDCTANSFGDGCSANSFGNSCKYNTFGDYCITNSFGNDCHSNAFDDFCDRNTVFEYVYCIKIVNNTSPKAEIGRYTILSGQYGTDLLHKYQLTVSTLLSNQNYAMYVGMDTSGSVRVWNPATPFIAVTQGLAEAGKFLVVEGILIKKKGEIKEKREIRKM